MQTADKSNRRWQGYLLTRLWTRLVHGTNQDTRHSLETPTRLLTVTGLHASLHSLHIIVIVTAFPRQI